MDKIAEARNGTRIRNRRQRLLKNLSGEVIYADRRRESTLYNQDVFVKPTISFGICAYNEEKNIGNLLQSIQSQNTEKFQINQIFVISSACRDKTDEITENFHAKDPRIELIKEPQRNGKAAAINLFLKVAKGDICILISADTVIPPNSLELVCSPFLNPKVGMTGGHPIPVNNPASFMGFVSKYIWELAHQLSLSDPKLGEYIAFRNVLREISAETAVDEAFVEVEIKNKGYTIAYVPEAIVYNKGPATVKDFLKQRRRIYSGHLHLKNTKNYKVSSMGVFKLMKIVVRSIKPDWRFILWTPAAVFLEFYARCLGSYDFYVKKRNPYKWEMVPSTKATIEYANQT
jgi:cellulose synthase/poly-beta-1,6-N-acetylglucosamine synthase-like glycosyltransferase